MVEIGAATSVTAGAGTAAYKCRKSVHLRTCNDHGGATMLKFWFSLLGKTSKKPASTKPAPAAARAPARAGPDYRAVSIDSRGPRCAAAKRCADTRFLMREAPPLPLPACTMAAKCTCIFRKVPDRRDADRRLFGGMRTTQWFTGRDSRTGVDRRS
jgi:hypothetical protein